MVVVMITMVAGLKYERDFAIARILFVIRVSECIPGVASKRPGVASNRPGVASNRPGVASKRPARAMIHSYVYLCACVSMYVHAYARMCMCSVCVCSVCLCV